METFEEYCKNYILEHIDEYEGQGTYASDLAYLITDAPNMDGTLTYSRHAALEYLSEWWEDAADYFDYETDNYGKAQNPFERPEAYMVCMVIEGVASLISQCDIVDELWNDEIELTPDIINKIKEQINDLHIEW